MGGISDSANTVYRDDAVQGVPSTGPNDPVKADIRQLFTDIDNAFTSLVATITADGGVVWDTLAHLQADTAHPDYTLGFVVADGLNNGIYYLLTGVWRYSGLVITAPVHLANLGSDVVACLTGSGAGPLIQVLAPESGYVYAILDANRRPAFTIDFAGNVSMPKLAIPLGVVDRPNLAPALAPYVPQPMSSGETGFVFAVVDATGKYALAVDTAGGLHMPKLSLPPGSVGLVNLAPEVAQYVPQALSPESGYVYAIVDAAGKLAFGITTAGGLTIPGLSPASIPLASIGEANLTPLLDRQVMPHIGDVVETQADSWRATFGSVGVDTSVTGTLWTAFPPILTRCLRGKNLSGVSLQFRPNAALGIRGKRPAGAWSPYAVNAVDSVTFVANCYAFAGAVSLSPASAIGLPATGVAGQYYRYASATSVSFNGVTMVMGDLVVWGGAAWVAQPAPVFGAGGSPRALREDGDWWAVTAAGAFDGQVYAIGDRIVYVGFDSYSGIGNALWYHGRPTTNGELFYNGTFAPGAASLPAGPAQGDVYQASAAGTDTTSGFTFAAGDYAIFDAGVWGKIVGGAVTTVAAGAMIPGLPCVASASEWEVRRADLSVTSVGVLATCRHQSSTRRAMDSIVCRSDSMFDVPNIPAQLGALIKPRVVTKIARGGGSARNVLATKEYEVGVQGDPYRGQFEFIWMGANNPPSITGDAAYTQTVEVAHKLIDLLGARDRRFCFLTVLGQNLMSFNGTRIVSQQHEDMFHATGALYALEDFFLKTWPEQVINTRTALLAASANSAIQDVRAPGTGLTEAQTSALYGWVPQSYYFPPAGLTVPLPSLNLLGFRSANGLPTGGAPNDCYTRSGGTPAGGLTAVVGNLIVNQAGVWGEYAFDFIHLSPGVNAGGQYLAAAMAAYLAARAI